MLGSWSLQCWQPGTAGCRFCLGAGARGHSQGPGRPGATKGLGLHRGQARAGESVADSTLLLRIETSLDYVSALLLPSLCSLSLCRNCNSLDSESPAFF
jgi:hypothetical protein